MEMTKEEIEALRLEMVAARAHCRECANVLHKLNKLTKSYRRSHDLWRKRFEKADRTLAEVDGRVKVVTFKREEKKKNPLTKQEILALVKEIEGEES